MARGKKKDLNCEDENSLLLGKLYAGELSAFLEKYISNDECRIALTESRGWKFRKDGKLQCKKCPKCKEKNVIALPKPRSYENRGKRTIISYQFRCYECRKQFGAGSGTLFNRYSQDLWLCFLTLYSMGLLNGKLPKTYLIRTYYQFLVEQGSHDRVASDKQKRKKYESIEGKIENISKKLSVLFEAKKIKKKNSYLRRIGVIEKGRTRFLDWYHEKDLSLPKWHLSWTPGRCDVDNYRASLFAYEVGLPNVSDVQFLKRPARGIENTWVLCFQIGKTEKVKRIRWLFVDKMLLAEFPEKLKSDVRDESIRQKKEKYARCQIVEAINNIRCYDEPFKLDRHFKDVFADVVESMGRRGLNCLGNGNNLIRPDSILDEIVCKMIK